MKIRTYRGVPFVDREEEIPNQEVISEIEEILSQRFILYGYKKVTA